MNTYSVNVFTGNKRGAGTDATVHITMFGDQGDSGQMVLDNDKNNFERGKKDTFTLECPHLGKLKKIRIGEFFHYFYDYCFCSTLSYNIRQKLFL